MKYLVVGLESSCTKAVAQMIAYSLGISNTPDSWDGHEEIKSDVHQVCHRSMPHHFRDSFIDYEFASRFDYTVVVTRDWNCSLKSKILNHTPDYNEAVREHLAGIQAIKNILKNNKAVIFSYETAFLLQEDYTLPFLYSIEIDNPRHVEFFNVNEKYMAATNG